MDRGYSSSNAQLQRSMPSHTLWFAAGAICLAPSVFAITTFEFEYRWSLFRYFAFAILASEALVIACAWLAGHRPVEAFSRLSTSTRIGALVWIGSSAFVAFLTAEHIAFARMHFIISVLHAWLALAVWDRLTSAWKGEGLKLLLAASLGAVFYAVVLIALMLLGAKNNPDFNFTNVGIGVTNVRQLGFYGIVGGAIAAAIVALSENKLFRSVAIVLLVLGSALTFWSGGRAAIVGLLLAIFLAIWATKPQDRWKVVRQTALAVLVGCILSNIWLPSPLYGATRFITAIFGTDQTASVVAFASGRVEIWIATAQAILDAPLFGHGEGQFRWKVEAIEQHFNHPHNAILQFLYQWGVAGTVAVLVMAWPAARAIPNALRQDRMTAAAALGVLVGLGAMSLLEGSLFHFYPTGIFALSLAVLAAMRTSHPATARSK